MAVSKKDPELLSEVGSEPYPGRYCGVTCSTLVAVVVVSLCEGSSVRDNAGNQNIPLTAITTIKTTAKTIFRFLSMQSLLQPVISFSVSNT